MKTTLIAILLLSLRLFLPGFAQHQPLLGPGQVLEALNLKKVSPSRCS